VPPLSLQVYLTFSVLSALNAMPSTTACLHPKLASAPLKVRVLMGKPSSPSLP
jgi:hypothetical protein